MLSWIYSTLTEFRFRHFVSVNSICSLSGMNAVRKSASWIYSMLTEFRFRHFVPVNSFRSLSGINAVRKSASWIYSMLTEFRFRHFVPVNSFRSLSGINAVRKSAIQFSFRRLRSETCYFTKISRTQKIFNFYFFILVNFH